MVDKFYAKLQKFGNLLWYNVILTFIKINKNNGKKRQTFIINFMFMNNSYFLIQYLNFENYIL